MSSTNGHHPVAALPAYARNRGELTTMLDRLEKGHREQLLRKLAGSCADISMEPADVDAAILHVLTGGTTAPTLEWKTAAQLRRETPAEPVWVWKGYLARAAVTLFVGKPKVGKSTAVMALCEAIVSEDVSEFLGLPVPTAPVVYVAEEGAATLHHKLPDTDRLHVLSREGAHPKPTWSALVVAATECAVKTGAALVVIDTFAYWADLGSEREQDAGAVGAAMAALTAAARKNVAVLLVHHQRKSGGSDGDSVRGSSAIAGAVDVILELERLDAGKDGKAPPTHRQLVGLGRWPQAAPLLVIDYQPATHSWRVVGQAEDRHGAAEVGLAERLFNLMPDAPPGVTNKDIEAVLGGGGDQKKAWGTVLRDHIAAGRVVRDGRGVAGDPFRHRKPPPQQPPEVGAESLGLLQAQTGPMSGPDVGASFRRPHQAPSQVRADQAQAQTLGEGARVEEMICAFDATEEPAPLRRGLTSPPQQGASRQQGGGRR